MIVLDENITRDDAEELRRRGVHCRRIGTDIGHRGMDDHNDVLPLLRQGHQPTFSSCDADFATRFLCHAGYCLVVLAVPVEQVATTIRRFLRHPEFRSTAQRMVP